MQTTPQFTRLPEAMELADIGPYFASLRQHYRLSQQDVATHLHMRVRYVEAIEASQFSELPDKVYARGFVKHYAEFLGIDPDQVIEKCFGPQPVKKDDFFIPEPARNAGGSVKSWMVLLAIGFCAYAIFDYISQRQRAEQADYAVETVPETLLKSARTRPMPHGAALRCMSGASPLACLPPHRQTTFTLKGLHAS